MNETKVTVHGNVVAEPAQRDTRTGGVFTTFRIATTPRRRTADGRYVDGETSFYGVIAFNALGANVTASIHKGMPVIVSGTLSTREWQGADGLLRHSLEIDAEHVGPDLAWGRSHFERVSKAAALGHDRLAEPEVAAALRDLAERDRAEPDDHESDHESERPANVDADGVVHDEADAADAADGDRGAGGHVARGSFGAATGDPETDAYEVVDPLSA